MIKKRKIRLERERNSCETKISINQLNHKKVYVISQKNN